MPLYTRFLTAGIPAYLARYYWWAYLWDKSIWFFDQQQIINLILFNKYNKLLQSTLSKIELKREAKLLQLTCVYGKLTPSLLQYSDSELHLCDIAAGQLQLARSKTLNSKKRCWLARMNAESLGYAAESFDQVIVFFLLHELPPLARHHVYEEIARVVKHGGSVLITEYASTPHRHWLYRFSPFRWILEYAEPFLASFWQEDVQIKLERALKNNGKSLASAPQIDYCFSRFYRVMRFDISA